MTFFLIATIAAAVFLLAYAVVIRGSLGLVKKRLADDPTLAEAADFDTAADSLPVDVEY